MNLIYFIIIQTSCQELLTKQDDIQREDIIQ
jgi:hypothetical protein